MLGSLGALIKLVISSILVNFSREGGCIEYKSVTKCSEEEKPPKIVGEIVTRDVSKQLNKDI